MARSKNSRGSKRQSSNLLWIVGGLIGSAILVVAALSMGLFEDEKASEQQRPFDSDFVPEVTGAPRVAVDQEVVDYGDVKLGTSVTTVFNVRNMGDIPLEILGEPRVELVEGC